MLVALINRWNLRKAVAACMIFLQAALPCMAVAQSGQGGGAGSSAAPSGFISAISGNVMVRRGTAPPVPVKPGDLFGPGTTFITGPGSTVALLFADGQNILLGPDSALRVDTFRFDQKEIKSSRATLGLMSGMMRLVTGAIHTDNREGLVISAGNASVGILSKDVTAFVIEVDPNSLGVGAAAVTVGEISIRTPAGTIPNVAPDQYARWDPKGTPGPVVPLAAAPAVFQATVAASRATVIGASQAIDIQAAALLAALSALPPTAAGQLQAQAQVDPTTNVVLPAVAPGGGGGCVGSPC